jgi:hypothetical protein
MGARVGRQTTRVDNNKDVMLVLGQGHLGCAMWVVGLRASLCVHAPVLR